MRAVICAAVGILSLALPVSAQQTSVVAVGVVTAERKPVTKSADFVGRIDAVDKVDIRARITGFLENVLFKEGDFIKQGAPLYSIERGLFEAAVGQAQGSLERSKAAKVLTEVQLQRAEELVQKGAGTVVARDQAKAADDQAEGAILIDQSNLKTAQINLGYTDITAPVTGKIGKTSITRGNVVGPDSGVLTTIVSQDPMYVSFPVSQRDLQRAREAQGVDAKNIKVRIRFADGSLFKETGTINFVNVTVDRTTDTVLVRATLPNPDSILIEGQLVRVSLESGTPDEKVVIPQSALIADQEGVYVFVAENDKATVKRVKPVGESGTGVIIDQGLSGGELVIVEGLQSVRPGTPVRATPVQPMASRS